MVGNSFSVSPVACSMLWIGIGSECPRSERIRLKSRSALAKSGSAEAGLPNAVKDFFTLTAGTSTGLVWFEVQQGNFQQQFRTWPHHPKNPPDGPEDFLGLC